jgi:hypothetical protein
MTRHIDSYREPITCVACGHRQQPTLLWLTCEYCSIVLEEHPHFRERETDHGEWSGQEVKRIQGCN